MTAIPRRGLCLVLSAPSGAGKTAISRALLESEPRLHLSVSVTTRPPRPGEIDGVHYHFLTQDAFDAAVRDGQLLEWAKVLQGTHYYGTPRKPVEDALAAGDDLIFDIDWQGYQQMRDKLPGDVLGVFVLPPDLAALESRLTGRGSDSAEEIARRMRLAQDEIGHAREFDHVVVNDDLSVAVDEVRSALHAARSATQRMTGLAGFVAGLGA
jgi:guanylate kinase